MLDTPGRDTPVALAAAAARIPAQFGRLDVLVNNASIGSTAGSLTWNSDPANPHRAMFGAYAASKTALHAVTLGFAFALEATGIKVNIACPGYTATALNNFTGPRTVAEGAREAVRLALLGPDGPTGTFSDEGGPVPW